MRALVVTADDVGLHSGMTLGAIKSHDEGIVTACSVVANGRAFEHAVDLLRDRPALDVGVHLTLVEERPLSSPERVRSLLRPNGAFLSDFRAFTRRYLLGGVDDAEIEKELRRQIERLLSAGLTVIHANSHQHLHVLPRVFEVVLRLAEEYRIPFVRVPSEPSAHGLTLRSFQIGVLNRIGRRARRRLAAWESIRTADRTVGIADAGRLSVEQLTGISRDLKGVTELVCHPGLGNDALKTEYDWGYAWEEETAALCDPRGKGALQTAGITLMSFRNVQDCLASSSAQRL